MLKKKEKKKTKQLKKKKKAVMESFLEIKVKTKNLPLSAWSHLLTVLESEFKPSMYFR